MLISYNWLRELTGTSLTPTELRERLTMVGLAIDAVEEIEGDSVLDVEVPSNRPDCLSHIGIAREVAVIESGMVHYPKSGSPVLGGPAAKLVSVQIEDPDLCPRYTARTVSYVRIGPSPSWMVKRLKSIDQRSINNIADITNYVLHERGQPLHAFDLSKLSGRSIVVRRARLGEKLKTLDGIERELDTDMLVIADAEKPVALAGIMGGQDSEISSNTSEVLIESAYFDPDSVRGTARKLGMDTEASRRFERGADRENVLTAQERCIDLISECAGGVASRDAVDIYPHKVLRPRVTFRPERVKDITSIEVTVPRMIQILAGLEFSQLEKDHTDAWLFAVPSWRIDVGIEEDLIEEIARHTGYDKIASELPPSNMPGEYQPVEMNRRSLRRILRALGFDEAINFSFIDTTHDDEFELIPSMVGSAAQPGLVTLGNPILEEVTRMRPTLLPGLIESLKNNLNHGTRDVRLFEIGRIFANSQPGELPLERDAFALIATGDLTEEGRAQASKEMDFYELKGALEAAVDAMKLGALSFSKAEVKHLREGQAARISVGDGTAIGTIGRLSASIAAAYKFRQPVYLAELDLTALLDSKPRAVQYKPLPRYPSVVRDVTLLVAREITFADLLDAVDSERVANYSGAELVGTYEGKNIPEDKRSVTLRVEYRSEEGTLRDEEVEERHRGLIDSLMKKFNAELH